MPEARASDTHGFRITVDAKTFAAQLAVVVRACSTRGSVEILRGVMLGALGDSCSLAATDLELSLRAHVPASVGKAGAVVLADAKHALALFKSLEGPLTIEEGPIVGDKDNPEVLVVSFTGATYRLAAYPVDDFPVWPRVSQSRGGTVDRASLVDTLSRVLVTVSKDESRPVLCGVLLSLDGASSVFGATATDSYRLSHDEAEGACVGASLEVTYPGRALAEVVRLAKRKGAEPVAWSCSDEHPEPLFVGFTVDGVEVVAHRTEGQFPNWKQLVPDRWELEASIVGAELVSAASRLSTLVASQRHTPTRVTVDASTGVVSLEVQGYDGTGAVETLPTPAVLAIGVGTGAYAGVTDPAATGNVGTIGFNGAFLIDAAKSCGETVRMRLIGPLRPALFLNGRDEFWHLLMPIRLAG